MKKGISKKFVLGFFNICKHTFFSIWKKGQPENCAGVLEDFQVYFFDSLEKGTSKRVVAGSLKICKYNFF